MKNKRIIIGVMLMMALFVFTACSTNDGPIVYDNGSVNRSPDDGAGGFNDGTNDTDIGGADGAGTGGTGTGARNQ